MNYPLLYQWEQLLSAHLPSLNSWQQANMALFSHGIMRAESCQQGQVARLAAEKGWTASLIREVVRCDENTVRLWLKRHIAEGIEGLKDEPRPWITPKVTPAHDARWIGDAEPERRVR